MKIAHFLKNNVMRCQMKKKILIALYSLFLFFSYIDAADPTAGQLVINEVFVGTASTSDYDGSEYIEIYNKTASAIDLQNVYIMGTEYDGTCGGEDVWRFPAGSQIPAYGYVIVVKDVADGDGFCDVFPSCSACSDWQNIYEMYDADQSFEYDHASVPNMILATAQSTYDDQIVLIGGGSGYGKACGTTYNMYDQIILRVGSTTGTIIDEMDWADIDICTGSECTVGGSAILLDVQTSGDTILQRCPNGNDTNDPSADFKKAIVSQATPLSANFCCNNGDSTAPVFGSTFTIKNGGDKITLLLSWTAATDPENPMGIQYKIYRSGTDGFTPEEGNLVETVTDTSYLDHPLEEDKTYYYRIRAYNCAGLYAQTDQITGATTYSYNTGAAGSVLINEVMINPQAAAGSDYDEAEYFEFYNRTAGDIDLSGWRFRDEPEYYYNWWAFPPDTIIPAGGYLLVARTACSGGTDDYINVYPSAPTPDFEIFDDTDQYDADCYTVPDLYRWNDQDSYEDGISLSSTYDNDCSLTYGCYGDGIQLVDGAGTIIDQIAYNAFGGCNETVFDSMPFIWDMDPIPFNVSIGRNNVSYDYDTTPGDFDSWTCADFYKYATGTPKAANNTARTRVVSKPVFFTGWDASSGVCPAIGLGWYCQKCVAETRIYRKTSAGVTTADLYQTVAGYTPSFTDTGVALGNTYYYRVGIYYDSVLSMLSDEISVTVTSVCPFQHLVISEVYYDVDGPDTPYEFIEIYNPTSSSITLTNYKIGDEERKMDTSYKEGMYQFPVGATIAAGQTQVIANYSYHFEDLYGFKPNYEFCWSDASQVHGEDDPAVPNMIQYNTWTVQGYNFVSLGNSADFGDEVLILDGSDRIVDFMNYGQNAMHGHIPHPGVTASGQTLVRSPVWVDTDDPSSDFAISDPASPGCASGTNGTIPSAASALSGYDVGSSGSIYLAFTAAPTGCNIPDHYDIYQSVNSDMSGAVLIGTTSGDTASLSGIGIGTLYYYALKTVDDGDLSSLFSNTVPIKCGPYGTGVLTTFTKSSNYIIENTEGNEFTFLITKEASDISEIQIEVPPAWIAANGGKLLATMFENDAGCAQATRDNRVIFYKIDGTPVLTSSNADINITFELATAPASGEYEFKIYTDGNSPTDGVNPPNFDSYSIIKFPRALLTIYSAGGEASLYTARGSGDGPANPILADSIGNYISIDVASLKDALTGIRVYLPSGWSGISNSTVSVKKLPEYEDWDIYCDFNQTYVDLSNTLAPGETVAFIFYDLISSDNVAENGFIVQTKTELNPDYTACTGSPVTVGMTAIPWFHAYFTEPLDASYGRTAWLKAYGGAWTGTGDMSGIYSAGKHFCDSNLDDVLAYLITQGRYNLYATAYVDQTAGTTIDNAVSGFAGSVKRLWHEGGTSGNTSWGIRSNFGVNNCRNDYSNGCDGSSNMGGDFCASHNKFYVLDVGYYGSSTVGDLVCTGSWNWSSTGTAQQMQNQIYFRHPDIAKQYYNQHHLMWDLGYSGDGWCKSPNLYMGALQSPYYDPAPGGVNYHSIGGGENNIEAYMLGFNDMSDIIGDQIANADHTIYLAISSFTDYTTMYHLQDAYDRGVYIEGVFSSSSWTTGRYYDCQNYGMNVAVDNGGGTYYCHNKYMVIDPEYPASDPTVITGSPNWSAAADSSSTEWTDGTHNQNDENMVVIHDANLANIFFQNYKYIWGNALYNQTGSPAASTFDTDTLPDSPTALLASNTGLDKSIYLNWTAPSHYGDGEEHGLTVKGYNIYRSTSSNPSDGGGGGGDCTEVFENFDGWTGATAYGDYTYNGFQITNGLRDTTYPYSSPSDVRLRNATPQPSLEYIGADGNGKDGGVGTISFWYRSWDGNPSFNFTVSYSVDGGAYVDIATVACANTTYQQWSYALNNTSDNIKVRVTTTYAERMHIDDFSITCPPDGGGGGSGDWTLLKSLHPYTTYYDTDSALEYNVPYYYAVEAVDSRSVSSVKSDTATAKPGDYVRPRVEDYWIQWDSTGNTAEIYIKWNEDMYETAAETLTLFRLNGALNNYPNRATLLSDERTDKLDFTASRLTPGAPFFIRIYSQRDNYEALGGGNLISPNPQDYYFTLPVKSKVDLAVYAKGDYSNATFNGAGDWLLYSVWSKEVTPRIAFMKGTSSTESNIYVISGTDTSAVPVSVTLNADLVTYLSQFTWSPDSTLIAFAAIDGFGRSHIFTEPSDGSRPGRTRISPVSTTDWGNWLDPDWYDFNPGTPDRGDSIAVSIDGDLWVFDPYSTAPDKGTKALTDFSLYTDTNESTSLRDKLLQPKWSPDGTKITFVRDYPASNRSDIYILADVQAVLASGTPVVSWSSSDLVAVTGTNLPSWCPSWTINGDVISYIEDAASRFDNALLWVSAPDIVLADTNFDIFMRNVTGTFTNTPAALIANNPFNEAFAVLAPSGGDKMSYVSMTHGISSDTYALSLLSVQVGGSVSGIGGILHDNSGTYVDVPEGALASDVEITINAPITDPPSDSNGSNLISMGEVREFYADGGGITFEKPVTMTINYTAAVDNSGNGVNSTADEENLKIWYYNNGAWEQIGGKVITGGAINNGGSITIQTDHFSTYGIFMLKKAPAKSGEFRIVPNPYRPSDGNSGTGSASGGIMIDRLSDSVERISIYNIAGELVADWNEGTGLALEYLPSTEDQSVLLHSDYSGLAYEGGLARWDVKNDDLESVASGIYIIVVKDAAGEETFKKLAVIK